MFVTKVCSRFTFQSYYVNNLFIVSKSRVYLPPVLIRLLMFVQICLGGEVPFSYYLREQCLLDPDKWTTVTLAAGSQLDLEFNVTEPKSLLK